MVNIFGGSTLNGGSNGKRGPPGKRGFPGEVGKQGPSGEAGPLGKRGKQGENSSFYSQYFQHSATRWDIDFQPNFWIDGYDIQKEPFRLLNKYDYKYNAIPYSKGIPPSKGTDLLSGRYTVRFNGSQYFTCPMDWNSKSQSIDNLQVFIVFKYNSISGSGIRDGLFGHDNGGWDRFATLVGNGLTIGGVDGSTYSGGKIITKFPKDANPVQTSKFCVLCVHWNALGISNCGKDKSGVYCNGKKLATFTAVTNINGTTSFALGNLTLNEPKYGMKGDIGRFLACGSREHPMDEEEILIVHKYLMEEWKINIVGGPKGDPGPQGPRGLRGEPGPKAETIKDVASKSYVIEMVENATSHDCIFIASLEKDTIIKNHSAQLNNWKTIKSDTDIVQIESGGQFIISQPSRCAAYLHCRAPNTTQEKVTFRLYSRMKAAVDTQIVKLVKGELVSVLLNCGVPRKGDTLTVQIEGDNLDLIVERGSRVEVTETHRWESPQLLTSSVMYPWTSQTITINNDIETYNFIHITGNNGNTFITKTISPIGMYTKNNISIWKISIANKINLEFSGNKHQTLKVETKEGYQIISMYGVRCFENG